MKYQLIMPSSIDHLRNAIIEKLMAISNKDYLMALNKLLEGSATEDEEPLPRHVIEGIRKAQSEIKEGFGKTSEEVFKKYRNL